MSRTFIFLAFLVVFSYCVEKRADNINQIIDELVELNKSLKTPTARIGGTISSIRAAASASANAFNNFYTRVHNNCNQGAAYLKQFVGKLNGDLVSVRAGINSANARIKKNAAAAARITGNLKNSRAALKRAHARQAQESRVFRGSLAEAEQKLIVIRHVRNIVVDELLNGKAPASLLQVNTISTKLQELKTMVEKDNDTMFSSVVSTLMEMVSERNLNDQTILRKFLASLSKLNNKIKTWRRNAIADHKKIRRLNKAANAAKLNSIRALGKLLVEARSAITGANHAIDELNNAQGLINRALTRKARETKQWNNLCQDQARVANIFRTAHQNLSAKVGAVAKALLG